GALQATHGLFKRGAAGWIRPARIYPDPRVQPSKRHLQNGRAWLGTRPEHSFVHAGYPKCGRATFTWRSYSGRHLLSTNRLNHGSNGVGFGIRAHVGDWAAGGVYPA